MNVDTIRDHVRSFRIGSRKEFLLKPDRKTQVAFDAMLGSKITSIKWIPGEHAVELRLDGDGRFKIRIEADLMWSKLSIRKIEKEK